MPFYFYGKDPVVKAIVANLEFLEEQLQRLRSKSGSNAGLSTFPQNFESLCASIPDISGVDSPLTRAVILDEITFVEALCEDYCHKFTSETLHQALVVASIFGRANCIEPLVRAGAELHPLVVIHEYGNALKAAIIHQRVACIREILRLTGAEISWNQLSFTEEGALETSLYFWLEEQGYFNEENQEKYEIGQLFLERNDISILNLLKGMYSNKESPEYYSVIVAEILALLHNIELTDFFKLLTPGCDLSYIIEDICMPIFIQILFFASEQMSEELLTRLFSNTDFALESAHFLAVCLQSAMMIEIVPGIKTLLEKIYHQQREAIGNEQLWGAKSKSSISYLH